MCLPVAVAVVAVGGGVASAQGEPEDAGSRDGGDSSGDCARVVFFYVPLSAAAPRSLVSAG